MNSNQRDLRTGSVSIIESNVKWHKYEWRENTYQTLWKKIETRAWNTAHQKQNLKANTNQVEPSGMHLATGRTGLSTQAVMVLVVGAGAMLLIREGVKRLTYITVYRACDQKDPGDTMASMNFF
jgi:hypothetical protein